MSKELDQIEWQAATDRAEERDRQRKMKLPDVFEYERSLLKNEVDRYRQEAKAWRLASYIIFALLVVVTVMLARK